MHALHRPHDPLDGVRRALARSHRVLVGVEPRIEGDDLVLAGTVRTWYAKQLAQEAVRCVKGVSRIRNELRVER